MFNGCKTALWNHYFLGCVFHLITAILWWKVYVIIFFTILYESCILSYQFSTFEIKLYVLFTIYLWVDIIITDILFIIFFDFYLLVLIVHLLIINLARLLLIIVLFINHLVFYDVLWRCSFENEVLLLLAEQFIEIFLGFHHFEYWVEFFFIGVIVNWKESW